MLKKELAELQSRLDTSNMQVKYRKLVKRYQELKVKVQHDTADKDDLVHI